MTPSTIAANSSPPAPLRPGLRFAFAHPAHAVALGLGSGCSRWAPGTAGTLFAWATFLLLDVHLSDAQWALAIATLLALGTWASKVTAEHLHLADPPHIVVDEIAAFWLVLLVAMPTGFWGQALAFALFRYFDAAKPGPVRWADSVFKGSGWRGAWGIMFDDLVAAGMTLLTLALFKALWF